MSGSRQIHVGPAMQIIDPEHGDITADVARELAAARRESEERLYAAAQRRQAHIARTCGQEARVLKGAGGMRLVAQIDEGVFNYWEAREGNEFWKHELDFMLKRHPEMAVRAKSDNPTVGYTGAPRTGPKGKRGRWAA